MLRIASSSYYDENNIFRLHEIYVSDDSTTYILAAEDRFSPFPYKGVKVEDLVYDQGLYPSFNFSPIRIYKDDDAKSFSTYLKTKLSSINLKQVGADKAIYDVISNIGERLENAKS